MRACVCVCVCVWIEVSGEIVRESLSPPPPLPLSLSLSLSLCLHPSKDAAVGAWVSRCWNRPSLGRISIRLVPIAKESSSHDTVKGT
jgi:hypothetical protein